MELIGPDSDLSAHRVLVVPTAFLLREQSARALRRWVHDGGHLLVGPFFAVVDETDTVFAEGYLGPLRDVLGVWMDEYHPVRRGESLALDDGTTADLWSEAVVVTSAEVVVRFGTGPDTGGPALTRARHGAGSAWYLATRPDEAGLASVVARVLAGAGLLRPHALPSGVEVVRRRGDTDTFTFVINHTADAVTVEVSGTDLLTGATADRTTVAGGGVAVLAAATGPRPSDSG